MTGDESFHHKEERAVSNSEVIIARKIIEKTKFNRSQGKGSWHFIEYTLKITSLFKGNNNYNYLETINARSEFNCRDIFEVRQGLLT